MKNIGFKNCHSLRYSRGVCCTIPTSTWWRYLVYCEDSRRIFRSSRNVDRVGNVKSRSWKSHVSNSIFYFNKAALHLNGLGYVCDASPSNQALKIGHVIHSEYVNYNDTQQKFCLDNVISCESFEDVTTHFLQQHQYFRRGKHKIPEFTAASNLFVAAVSNSNWLQSQMRTHKVTRGPDYDADATLLVLDPH